MPPISKKNQVTIPVAALEEAGLHAGDEVVVQAFEDGELRIRRGASRFEAAFGALTGTYPDRYLEQLDEEDERRELGPVEDRQWVNGRSLRGVWQTPAPRSLAADIDRFPDGPDDPSA